MRILVTNVGSTSLKYNLYDFPEEKSLASGRVERIGSGQGSAQWSNGDDKGSIEQAFNTHREAIQFVLEKLQTSVIQSLEEINCVSFKTVIAKGFNGCEILDETVLKAMEDYVFLAPAHNPPYINAIRLFEELLPNAQRIGLFEPAFHLTMPDYARTYPIPKEWRDNYGIQRYGFHGASHRYVTERSAELMNKDKSEINLISCHLGGSSSLCAVANGKSVDTSMGFTPQTGTFHATRIGDFDPFAVFYVMKEENLSIDDAIKTLTKESGMAGLSGVSEDMRDVEAAMDDGNDDARLAFDAFAYSIKKYIGAYYAVLGRLDVLAFAGGIGERGKRLRAAVCNGLQHLGVELDESKNEDCNGDEMLISIDGKPVSVWVVPTNEEVIVARAAYEKLHANKA